MNRLSDNSRSCRRLLVGLVLVSLLAGGWAWSGCTDTSSSSPRGSRSTAGKVNTRDVLVKLVAENIGREDLDQKQLRQQLSGWLNQWVQQNPPAIEWQRDALIDTLPEALRKQPAVAKLLGEWDRRVYDDRDVDFLQEAVWLHEISRTAKGGEFKDLPVAERLFDWTVRNLQLEDDPPAGQQGMGRTPREIVFRGRARAIERAWVFILLLRQQHLDGVMLALVDPENPRQARPWVPALASEGQLYLFDPRLGLPIPGPGGKSVATLAQAMDDESVLGQLDLEAKAEGGTDGKRTYPVKAGDLTGVVALVEGSPGYVARRIRLAETHWEGGTRAVFSVSPTAIAERVQPALGTDGRVELWSWPYEARIQRSQLNAAGRKLLADELKPFYLREVKLTQVPKPDEEKSQGDFANQFGSLADEKTRIGAENPAEKDQGIARHPLRAARISHLCGRYEGEKGAIGYYLRSRPDDKVLQVLQAYNVRPPVYFQRVARMQESATYWLGLLKFDDGLNKDDPEQFHAANDFCKQMLDKWRGGPWTYGARYLRARCYEKAGKIKEAIEIYEVDTSPQSYGNKLRARQLKEGLGAGD